MIDRPEGSGASGLIPQEAGVAVAADREGNGGVAGIGAELQVRVAGSR